MSDERRESLLARLVRWHGLLTHATRGARIAGITALSIACVAMVATQLNYVVVGDAHMIVVLAPITACALLYGAVPATAVGATAGLAELIHATLLPLDYYEKYFTVPWNSVVLFALVGFVMGLLFAHADQYRGQSGWRRPAGIVVCCAIGSAVFTLFFHQSTYLINSLLALELPTEFLKQLTGSHEVFSQWLADFGLMVKLPVVLPAKPQYQPVFVLRKRYARLATPKGATSLPHSALTRMSLSTVGTKSVSMYAFPSEVSDASRESYGGIPVIRKNRTMPVFVSHAEGIVNDADVSAMPTAPTNAVSCAFVATLPMSPGAHVAISAFSPSPASAADIERTVAPVSRSHDMTSTVRAWDCAAANATAAKSTAPAPRSAKTPPMQYAFALTTFISSSLDCF